MGYYTSLGGEISIVPPLTHSELLDSPFTEFSDEGSYMLRVVVDTSEEERETNDGTVTVVTQTGITIEPETDDSVKAHEIVQHLQAILDAFPGHRFAGYISGEGEDNEDIWRLYARNGLAIKVAAEIVWNEPEEETA